MKILGKKRLTKVAVWLAAELLLNFVGLDNLADYSEFIFEHDAFAIAFVR
jgi:hypothetical protein